MTLYLDHFSLRELPFRITPAVDFFYRGSMRGETLNAIKYAIRNGEGILAVIGEVGSGKSMLVRVLIKNLANEAELVYVANPSLSDREIVFHIAEELGISIDAERHVVARNLQNHLIELHAKGRRVVVCIDEAQAMPDESLEQVRLLSNLETSREKLVQIVMFGQPELAEKLDQRHMRQLRERITSSYRLRNLSPAEVREYIKVRLVSAGLPDGGELFSASCCAHISQVSQGISRRINILCDKAMLAAFADDSSKVYLKHAKLASADANYQKLSYQIGGAVRLHNMKRVPVGMFIAFAAVAAAVGATVFQLSLRENDKSGGLLAETLSATGQDASPLSEMAVAQTASQQADGGQADGGQADGGQADGGQADQLQTQHLVQATEQAATSLPAQQLEADSEPNANGPAPVAAAPVVRSDELPRLPGGNEPSAGKKGNADQSAAEPATVSKRAEPPQELNLKRGERLSNSEQIAIVDNPRWRYYPGGSYLRQRLNATQTLFGVLKKSNYYTARLLTVPRERAIEIEKYLRDLARFYLIRNVMIYPAVSENRKTFVITYGQYESEFMAELFVHELPSFFRSSKPFVQALVVSQFEALEKW